MAERYSREKVTHAHMLVAEHGSWAALTFARNAALDRALLVPAEYQEMVRTVRALSAWEKTNLLYLLADDAANAMKRAAEETKAVARRQDAMLR